MSIAQTSLLPLAVRQLSAEYWPWLQLLVDTHLLFKPRLSLMVLVTVAAGFLVAAPMPIPWSLLLHTLLGTAGVAFAASILNQVLERQTDARMQRTQGRPIAAGRFSARTASGLGLCLAASGLAYLLLSAGVLPAALAAVTLLVYVGVYTPLKTRTAWNTVVGAVTGALPPLIGAAAAAGTLSASDWTMAALLFLWQFPHFWAIAWIYREDYARGGLVMLPNVDVGEGGLTGRLMVKTSVWLLLVSLLPTFLGQAGLIYFWTALVLGLGFAGANLAFWLRPSVAQARLVLRSSLMYLPAVLLLWLLDGPLRWRL